MATWMVTYTRTVPGSERPYVGYWFGPNHCWGTTSGPYSDAATFATRKAAEDALRKVFGRHWRQRGYAPVRAGGGTARPNGPVEKG